MLCSRCEAHPQRTSGKIHWSGVRADRLDRMLCAQCGTVLPAQDQGERLLDKLSQLARFGLVAEATLLTPSRGDG